MSREQPPVVELQIRIGDVSPADVFPYLVESERYARWQGVKAELDPRPGGIFRVWVDARTIARGEFLEVEPPHRVVFTWGWEGDERVPPGSSTVEMTLEDEQDGTLVSLRHTGLPDDGAAAMHEEGWRFFVERLSTASSGGDPGPMPPAGRRG